MTRNTAAIVQPKQMDNLSSCENGIKMFSAMADVNHNATTYGNRGSCGSVCRIRRQL